MSHQLFPNPVALAAGTPNLVQATVDFGFASRLEGDVARVTVGAPWVTANSAIWCQPAAVTTTDHDPDDAVVENIQAWAENIVVGQTFDIVAYAPQGAWGRYNINAWGN